MTSVTRPTAGSSGEASWAQSVADALNLGGKILTADVTTNSGSWSDLTGLSFTATSGKVYSIAIDLLYNHDDTSGGPVIGFDHAGGSCWMFLDYAGETSATSEDRDTSTAADTGSGVASVNSGSGIYWIHGRALFQCTSTGTWTLRMKRNTAGTLTVKKGSAIRVVEG